MNPRSRLKRTAACVLFLLLGYPATGFGQSSADWRTPSPDGPITAPGPMPRRTEVTLHFDQMYLSPSDLKDHGGGFAVFRQRVSAEYSDFTLGYTRKDYQWQTPGALPFGKPGEVPWEVLNTAGIKYKKTGAIRNDWRYYFSGELSSSFEKEIGSPGLDLLIAGGYNFSPHLKIRAGAAVLFHDIRTVAVPVAGFKWWGGGSGPDNPLFSASIGLPESTLTCHLSPAWSVTGSVLADSKVFRLADDSVVIKKGYMESRDLVLGLMVGYHRFSNTAVRFGIGYDVYREMKLFDSGGSETEAYTPENTISYRFEASFVF